MTNAIYFYTTDIWKNIPDLMTKKGITCKFTFSYKQGYGNNFYLWEGLPHNLYTNCRNLELITYYSSIKDIYIDPDIQKNLFTLLPLYIEQISRLDFYNQACYHDYINHFNIFIKFLYKLLVAESVDIVFMTSYPHHGIDLLLTEIAKILKIRVIHTLCLFEPETRKQILHYSDTTNPDNYYHLMNRKRRIANIKIPNSYKKNLPYMKNIPKITAQDYKVKFYFSDLLKIIRYIIQGKYDKQKLRSFIQKMTKYYYVKDSFSERDKYVEPVDFTKKYVYFGLHLQPEYTTSFWGKEYVDQLLAIEHLSLILPNDWKIFVKENPKQIEFQRHPMFYERLHLIDKVQLVPHDTNTYKLIEHSQCVASITGTMIYEAVSGGKPAIIFGRYWYENLPGVFRYDKHLNISEILKYKIDHNRLEKTVNDFMETGIECVQEHTPDLSLDFLAQNDQKIVNILLEAINS